MSFPYILITGHILLCGCDFHLIYFTFFAKLKKFLLKLEIDECQQLTEIKPLEFK